MKSLASWVQARFPGAAIRRDGEVELDCPWCGKARKVWFNARTGRGVCFSCPRGFKATRLIMKVDSLTWEQAILVLGGFMQGDANVTRMADFEDLWQTPSGPTDLAWPEASAPVLALAHTEFGRIVLAYLHERGLSDEDIAFYQIRACWAGRECYRVLFPYLGRHGRVVYWGARRIDPLNISTVKIVYPKAAKDGLVYNLDVAAIHPRVVLVEGQIDAIHVGRHAAALGGKSISLSQCASLRRAGFEEVVVMLDNDEAGREATIPVLEVLLRHPWRVRLAAVPTHRKDPGECERSELEAAVDAAVEVAWHELVAGAEHLLTKARARYQGDMLRRVAATDGSRLTTSPGDALRVA